MICRFSVEQASTLASRSCLSVLEHILERRSCCLLWLRPTTATTTRNNWESCGWRRTRRSLDINIDQWVFPHQQQLFSG